MSPVDTPRRRRRLAALVPALLLAGCLAAPRPAPIAPAPRFDPFVFFDGASEGQGTLRILLHHARPVTVHSRGHREGERLILDQDVADAGSPVRHRRWELTQVQPGRYAGTLSDAAGPVSASTDGNCLHIRFAMKGHLQADQRLTLAPDGASAHNIMVVRRSGIVVAVLDETIRRLSAPAPESPP